MRFSKDTSERAQARSWVSGGSPKSLRGVDVAWGIRQLDSISFSVKETASTDVDTAIAVAMPTLFYNHRCHLTELLLAYRNWEAAWGGRVRVSRVLFLLLLLWLFFFGGVCYIQSFAEIATFRPVSDPQYSCVNLHRLLATGCIFLWLYYQTANKTFSVASCVAKAVAVSIATALPPWTVQLCQ